MGVHAKLKIGRAVRFQRICKFMHIFLIIREITGIGPIGVPVTQVTPQDNRRLNAIIKEQNSGSIFLIVCTRHLLDNKVVPAPYCFFQFDLSIDL